ncbi:MAG: CAP domain-containing protein [bacterium]|nr:CAP domain-containing protein [bacterium]
MKRLVLLVVTLSLFWAAFMYQNSFQNSLEIPKKIEESLSEEITARFEELVLKTTAVTEKAKEEFTSPPPLVVEKSSFFPVEIPQLTRLGIFTWTNLQRKTNSGYQQFRESSKLNEIAERRLKDLFEKQYFAHNSPIGENAGSLAKEIDYKYIAIGENIARGSFENDQELVQAWMDSPGHRANILNQSFTEIGVAVDKGAWEDRETWIGVQIFGKPLSDCPYPDGNLESNINTNRNIIDQLTRDADNLALYLESRNPETQEEVDEYNSKVEEYNNLIEKISLAVKETKEIIELYNRQVTSFNDCVAS